MTDAAQAAPTLGPATEALLARAYADAALITAQAAAAVLGVDVKTLRALTDSLSVRAIRVSRVRRYAEADLRRFLIEGQADQCPSTNPRKAPSSNTTFRPRVVAFTALPASKRAGPRKR